MNMISSCTAWMPSAVEVVATWMHFRVPNNCILGNGGKARTIPVGEESGYLLFFAKPGDSEVFS